MEVSFATTDGTAVPKEDIDLRSVYVGNVSFSCTAEDLQAHFGPVGPPFFSSLSFFKKKLSINF